MAYCPWRAGQVKISKLAVETKSFNGRNMESQRREHQFYGTHREHQFYGTHHIAPAMYKNLPTSYECWLNNFAVEMLLAEYFLLVLAGTFYFHNWHSNSVHCLRSLRVKIIAMVCCNLRWNTCFSFWKVSPSPVLTHVLDKALFNVPEWALSTGDCP